MECVLSISMVDGVNLSEAGPEQIFLEAPGTVFRPRLTFKGVTPALRETLERLRGEGASTGELAGMLLSTDGPQGLAKLYHYLGRLGQFAMLVRHIVLDGQPLMSIHPLSTAFEFDEFRIGRETLDAPFVLSRFALIRSESGQTFVECPRGCAEVRLHHRLAHEAMFELRRPLSVRGLVDLMEGRIDDEGARLVMTLLANALALVPSEAEDPAPELSDPVFGQWSFHDMLFHTRSRLGRHADPYGGTNPGLGKFKPLPAIKPTMSDRVTPLYKPDLETLRDKDVSFTRVLEDRATVRAHGDTPITADQLGEFLYRTCRVKQLIPHAGVSFRPYPGGGAIHELEIYPLVHRCDGLAPGLYHYHPLDHTLSLVTEPSRDTDTLGQLAGVTALLDHPPQVLLVVTARFQRVQIKYQSVAYSVILKDVGGLYQTMYLVACAMDLAPCALGGGHSDLFAQAAGLDYFAETSVGEFVLGSAPDKAADPAQHQRLQMMPGLGSGSTPGES